MSVWDQAHSCPRVAEEQWTQIQKYRLRSICRPAVKIEIIVLESYNFFKRKK